MNRENQKYIVIFLGLNHTAYHAVDTQNIAYHAVNTQNILLNEMPTRILKKSPNSHSPLKSLLFKSIQVLLKKYRENKFKKQCYYEEQKCIFYYKDNYSVK